MAPVLVTQFIRLNTPRASLNTLANRLRRTFALSNQSRPLSPSLHVRSLATSAGIQTNKVQAASAGKRCYSNASK